MSFSPLQVPRRSPQQKAREASFLPDYTFSNQETPTKDSIIATPLKIGFLGLGLMGSGMALNLLRSGHEVTVWNRTPSKVGPLERRYCGKFIIEQWRPKELPNAKAQWPMTQRQVNTKQKQTQLAFLHSFSNLAWPQGYP